MLAPAFLGTVALLLVCGPCVLPSRGESLVFPPYKHSYGIRKATQKHLFMFFGPLTRFSNPQGMATAKMKSRDDPSTENDDDEVVVYGVNAGRHEIIYNTSMWGLARYGERGSGKDRFLHPRGIATEENGNVFVADSGNDRIVHLHNPRRTVEWVRAYTGGGGSGPPLKGPAQVGVGVNGLLFVSDPGNRRIAVVDTHDIIVRSIIPPEGAFEDGPTTIAVADGSHPWSFFRSEQAVFCADRNGRRLWKFSVGGAELERRDMPPGHTAGYAAVDYYHNLWVTDTENHCVLKFDRALKHLDTFGSRGTGDNELIEPRGIAIWKRYGQTFIAEKQGAQYFWVGTDCTARSIEAVDDGRYRLSVTLTEHSLVSLLRSTGADTDTVMRRRMLHPGGASTFIEGPSARMLDDSAHLVLRIEPTYSSRTFRHWDYPLRIR